MRQQCPKPSQQVGSVQLDRSAASGITQESQSWIEQPDCHSGNPTDGEWERSVRRRFFPRVRSPKCDIVAEAEPYDGRQKNQAPQIADGIISDQREGPDDEEEHCGSSVKEDEFDDKAARQAMTAFSPKHQG